MVVEYSFTQEVSKPYLDFQQNDKNLTMLIFYHYFVRVEFFLKIPKQSFEVLWYPSSYKFLFHKIEK